MFNYIINKFLSTSLISAFADSCTVVFKSSFFYIPQIAQTSQDFVAVQQKLNDIILAHQLNPETNGMFVKGSAAVNGLAPMCNQSASQSGKISEICSLKSIVHGFRLVLILLTETKTKNVRH